MKINEENYVDIADKVISELKRMKDDRGKPVPSITTSQIRNLLALSADIHNEVSRQNNDVLSADTVSRIEYLRVRFVYESGREKAVKYFVEQADLLNQLKDIGKSKKNFELFSRYMEALVAFHRYYGGKD